MKKVFALLFVAGVFALTSCGKKEEATQETAIDSVAVEAVPAEPVSADTIVTDSTASASADTTKK